MSAFDDEFGLFGDDVPGTEEDERRSTLGARIIADGSEIVIDEIEPEDDDRGARGRPGQAGQRGGNRTFVPRRREREERRPALDPEVARDRATALLEFLAKGLVGKPETIAVFARDDQRQGLVLELEVAAEDLGKVIGRAGRVAQALRTVVRAGVEGRVAIEIIDVQADGQAGSDVAMTVEASAEEEADAVADQRVASGDAGDNGETGAIELDADAGEAAGTVDDHSAPEKKPRGRGKAAAAAISGNAKKTRGRPPRATANIAASNDEQADEAQGASPNASSQDGVASSQIAAEDGSSAEGAAPRLRTRRKRTADDAE